MKLKTMLAVLAAAGLASDAYAAGQVQEQGAQDGQAKDAVKADKMARVEVTGSSLKRINAETASPVRVSDAKQIEKMGARALLQVLDNAPENCTAAGVARRRLPVMARLRTPRSTWASPGSR